MRGRGKPEYPHGSKQKTARNRPLAVFAAHCHPDYLGRKLTRYGGTERHSCHILRQTGQASPALARRPPGMPFPISAETLPGEHGRAQLPIRRPCPRNFSNT
jgi:hypothetical protein